MLFVINKEPGIQIKMYLMRVKIAIQVLETKVADLEKN